MQLLVTNPPRRKRRRSTKGTSTMAKKKTRRRTSKRYSSLPTTRKRKGGRRRSGGFAALGSFNVKQIVMNGVIGAAAGIGIDMAVNKIDFLKDFAAKNEGKYSGVVKAVAGLALAFALKKAGLGKYAGAVGTAGVVLGALELARKNNVMGLSGIDYGLSDGQMYGLLPDGMDDGMGAVYGLSPQYAE